VSAAKSGSGFDLHLPRSLRAERRGDVAILALARAQKRNAIDDPTVAGIEAFFAGLPDGIKAVVLTGDGEHFCSGLDLGELSGRDIAQGIAHSRNWHRAFERIEFGKVPVVAVLHGAGSRSRRRAISGWRKARPITRCRKAAAASSSAAAARSDCRG
jgi:(methylthio)acryloyl-CoA hydratase